MPRDDTAIELQVIQDVLDTVEARIRAAEQCGLRLTVPRSRVYAAVLLAVVVSARETHRIPATLDRAPVLDEILNGAEPSGAADANQPVEQAIRSHVAPVN
ncbi:hypothetical protein [Nocardia concava]|uniref:hypothetical protein n=1 Tax=Nocardia concava TaxID=257281 RepID=UPI0002DE2E68|nr:hypothetical protein [Nocardia concava]